MPNRNELKILLMQIRKDLRIKKQERTAFATYAGITEEQLDVLDVFATPNFDESILTNYDALFIGGTSEANVLKPNENSFLPSAYKLINHCLDKNFPVFASCFGFQMAVMALDGEILHQEEGFEMGTIPISLTNEAKDDPLHYDQPNGFYAVSVHKQKAVELPENCIMLSYTDQCIHSFRVIDKPFWGFQFHPEVSKEHLVERLGIYQDQYTENADHFTKIINNAQDTPESAALVGKFVDRVLLKNE